MTEKNDVIVNESSDAFVKKTVRISLIAAAVLMHIIVLVIIFWSGIAPAAADIFLRLGAYDMALGVVDSVDEEDADAQVINRCRYDIASAMYNDGRFTDAREIFESLGDYSSSADMVLSCRYGEAGDLMAKGKYEDASQAFYRLGEFEDSPEKYSECRYAIAEQTLDSGDDYGAIRIFSEIKDYSDSYDRAYQIAFSIVGEDALARALVESEGYTAQEFELVTDFAQARTRIKEGIVAVGWYHTAAVKSDGGAVACGLNDKGQCDVGEWNDIVQIAAGAYHTVGLRSDGTVVATGDNKSGQCNVGEWKDVVQIAAGDYDTVALLRDGTVVSTGHHDYDIDGWHGVSRISAGAYMVCAIYGKGQVASSHISASLDSSVNYADISVSTACWAAMTATGELVSNIPSLPKWEDVLSVSVSPTVVLAVTKDGDLNVHFFRDRDVTDVSVSGDVVAAAAGGTHSAAVTDDGRVHTFGDNAYGQCDTSDWDLF
ncbi:MAG: hypothetical protein E7546_06355 [Ruminococcaceae bacterium]|nr:hypothetical protein [Oscillospiraceae bacterium]